MIFFNLIKKELVNFSKPGNSLVSADFLASDFISKEELPSLLTAANEKGVKLIQIIVSPCNFEETELASLQGD